MLARALWILQALMLLLLLAVCGNTANLVLARASTRHREIGAAGAGGKPRTRPAAAADGERPARGPGRGVGAAIAVWGTNALRAVPFSMAWPIRFQTRVDGTALAFAMLLGIACGLAFGLAPAVQLARVDPQQALRAGARGSGGRSRIRNILMGTEVALALAVLIVAAIFFRSVHDTRETDTGFRREGVLVAAYDLSGRGLDEAGTRAFATRLLDGLRAPARRGGGGHRALRSPRHPRHAAARLHAGGARTHGRRGRPGAGEHRHARLLPHDGHRAPRRRGLH
jgi:hypothetical protein